MVLSGGLIRRYALDSDRLTWVRIEFDTPIHPFAAVPARCCTVIPLLSWVAYGHGTFQSPALRLLDSSMILGSKRWNLLRTMSWPNLSEGPPNVKWQSIRSLTFVSINPICRIQRWEIDCSNRSKRWVFFYKKEIVPRLIKIRIRNEKRRMSRSNFLCCRIFTIDALLLYAKRSMFALSQRPHTILATIHLLYVRETLTNSECRSTYL